MMKKVLYGVAMTLLAGASVGTLQSCKDDVSDLKAQTSFDLGQLKQELKNDLDGLKSDLQGKIDGINGQLDGKLDASALNGILEEYAKRQYVLDEIEKLEQKLTGEGGAITEVSAKLDGFIETANGKFNELSAEDLRLAGEIAGAISSINDLQSQMGNYVLKTDFDAFKALVDPIVADYDVLKGRVAANEVAIATINSTLTDVQTAITAAEGRLDTVEGRVDQVEVRLNGIDQSLLDLGNDVTGLQNTVNNINSELAGLTARISTVEGDLALTKENVEELKQKVYFLGVELNKVKADLQNLSLSVDALSQSVAALSQRVDTLEQQLQNLSGRIDDIVNGILIQAADSPVFGNFSLPLGVKSTLLFNWYGDNKTGISSFPVYEYNGEYEYDKQRNDFAFAGMAEPVSIMDGIIGNVDLGTVYLTLNPVGHYFDNNNFVLETSKGTQLPVTIDVTKSNEELTFGYSRDRAQIEGNGFYAANVKIASDDPAERAKGVMAARVMIDDDLKSAVKNVLKDRNGRSAVALLKAVYGQLDGMLPAYALRYNWTNGGNNYSVLSNYDLAVATARPLSYNFYKDGSISHRLHKYGHINNFIEELKKNGNLHFDFSGNTLDLGDFSISIGSIDITAPDNIAEPHIEINFGTIKVYSTTEVDENGEPLVIGEVTPPVKKLTEVDQMVKDINNNVIASIRDMKGKIDSWSGQVETEINSKVTEMLGTVETKVNEMMTNISGQINDKVDGLITDFSNKAQPWFDRLNRVVDLYNRVADKINNVLEDPNHYLQVAMFYNQKNQGVGMLSNVVTNPTPFGAGNGVITLYASSYSGEIVCPAFKKYVACTKVYDKYGNPIAAAQENTLRSKVNEKAEFFNKVMDGYTIRYDVPASAIEKNYTYEITYQGLDYSGVTSTQKFYITVK